MPALVIEAELKRRLDHVNGQLAVKARIEKELALVEQRANTSASDLKEIEEAGVIIAVVEAQQQKELKIKVEKLLSYALKAIFEKDYRFVLQQDLRGNQTETKFMVYTPETGDHPIALKDAHGGGLVVVCSFLLQLVVMLSTKPKLQPLVIKDEPFMAVSEEYRLKLATFLQELAESTKVQFIFVTHEAELASIGDKRYRFKLVDGLTVAEEMDSAS